MSYVFKTTSAFDKEFKKLDKYTQALLKRWINKHLVNTDDPRATGKALVGNKKGFWRYRIGDYRLICRIEDDVCIILAIEIGHRRDIYQ